MSILIAIIVFVLCGALYFACDWKRYLGVQRPDSQLRPTGEIFMDPGSGKKMQVLENPKTGERLYREVQDPDAGMKT